MATRDQNPPDVPPAQFTTSEEDQREVAKLQARLQEQKQQQQGPDGSCNKAGRRLTSVEIADGAHKYVQIRAALNGEEQIFVTSRRGASYHRDAAEPLIEKLEEAGYYDIEVKGGGRIYMDQRTKKIEIFGFSYGFGAANHAISQRVVQADPRYKDYDVTISDSGY